MLPIFILMVLIGLSWSNKFVPPEFPWEQFDYSTKDENHVIQNMTAKRAEEFTDGLATYVSVTTISGRLNKVCDFVTNLLNGGILPTHVYVFISREPWLLDDGITESMLMSSARVRQLFQFTSRKLLSFIFTKNIGPHRKLLPLLARKWDEDCVIVTFDDESGRRLPTLEGPDKLFGQLLRYYRHSDRKSVVALKTRRIGLCDTYPHFVLSYNPWWGQVSAGRHEMLLLPTGTGGVLYRPRFFHPVVFDPILVNLTSVGDDLAFRLATMAQGVRVVAGCHPLQHRYVRGAPPGACPRIKDIFLNSGGEQELLRVTGGRTNSSSEGADVSLSFAMTSFGPVLDDQEHAGSSAKVSDGDENELPEDAWRRRSLLSTSGQGQSTSTTDMGNKSVDISLLGAGKGIQLPVGYGQNKPRSQKSLWGTNRLGGNDKQWRAASEYLQGLGILNLSILVLDNVYRERGPCFGLGVGGAGRSDGHVALKPLVQKDGVQRPRMCMLKTCKRSRKN